MNGMEKISEAILDKVKLDAEKIIKEAEEKAQAGIEKAKETLAEYARQAERELAQLPDGPGRQALATLVNYTVTRDG